jgi:hypothetical protein
MRRIFIFFLLAIACLPLAGLVAIPVHATTYYTSPGGLGTTCSEPLPCTLNTGISKSAAGDTVIMREGTYAQTVNFNKSGDASNPIIIEGEPNKMVVINGNYTIPTGTDWDPLVTISGAYVIVKNIEVTKSNGEGIMLEGIHSQIINVFSHHNHEAGAILVGDYTVADGCRIWYNSMHNEFGAQLPQGYGWGTGISAARHPSYATIKNTTSWNNWGEGISTFGADHTTLEDNISYDNWSVNMYIQNVQNALVQRNLIYRTPNNIFTDVANKASETGLVEDNEGPDSGYGISSDNVYINNLVYGAKGNFVHWSGSQGMVRALIANNTFVNASGRANIEISATSQDVQFRNNIVVQDDTSVPITSVGQGITRSNNLWSTTPSSNISDTSDIIGNALLARTGTIEPGQLKGDWFKLQSISPAINQAMNLTLVSSDYFKTVRPVGPAPDIGAHEYLTAKPGDYDGDGDVDYLDLLQYLPTFNSIFEFNTLLRNIFK